MGLIRDLVAGYAGQKANEQKEKAQKYTRLGEMYKDIFTSSSGDVDDKTKNMAFAAYLDLINTQGGKKGREAIPHVVQMYNTQKQIQSHMQNLAGQNVNTDDPGAPGQGPDVPSAQADLPLSTGGSAGVTRSGAQVPKPSPFRPVLRTLAGVGRGVEHGAEAAGRMLGGIPTDRTPEPPPIPEGLRQPFMSREQQIAERRKEGASIGLTGEPLEAYALTGKLPTRFGDQDKGHWETVRGSDDALQDFNPKADPKKRYRVRLDDNGNVIESHEAGTQDPVHVPSVAEQRLENAYGAKAAKLHKDVKDLTPQEKVDAEMDVKKQAAANGELLTPQELYDTARYDLLSGKTSNFGMGNNPNRTGYQKARAQVIHEMGPASVAEQAATQKADSSSLGSLVKMTDAVDAWENNAKLNLDQVLKASAQVGRTGSSLWNEYQQLVQGKLTEYPELRAFRVALETGISEYLKVMYSPTSAGGTTVDQRATGHAMLNETMAPEDVKAAIGQMHIDMQNRHETLHGQIDEVQERMKAGGTGASNAPPAQKPVRRGSRAVTGPGGAAPKNADEYLKGLGINQ